MPAKAAHYVNLPAHIRQQHALLIWDRNYFRPKICSKVLNTKNRTLDNRHQTPEIPDFVEYCTPQNNQCQPTHTDLTVDIQTISKPCSA